MVGHNCILPCGHLHMVSPVTTLMECDVEVKFRNLLRYPRHQGDGMVVPSQRIGNSYFIQMALQAKFPQLQHNRVNESRIKAAMFVSYQADYGHEKYCIWPG